MLEIVSYNNEFRNSISRKKTNEGYLIEKKGESALKKMPGR